MALIFQTGQKKEIPKDAVKISAEEALQYQEAIISNWPNQSDTFVLRTSVGILSGVSALSALLINNHFRNKLRLGHYGRATSYLAVIATPTILSGVAHFSWVRTKLILHKYECPVCLQTQAGVIQTISSSVWPFLLAPSAAFMYATRHFTYRLPSITEKPKEILGLWLKFTKSAKSLALALLTVNMFAGMFITSLEMSEYRNLITKMQEHERLIESGEVPLDTDFFMADKN